MPAKEVDICKGCGAMRHINEDKLCKRCRNEKETG